MIRVGSRRLSGRVVAGGALIALAAGGTVAVAADPRPDNARGAVVTIAPAEVAVGGKVEFTGTGFTGASGAGGEAVCLKLDDGNIAAVGATPPDSFGSVTSAPDGTIRGTVDLAKVNAETPVGPGAHWIRLLSGPGTCNPAVVDAARSVHAKFTVVPVPTPTPAPGATPAPAPVPTPTPTPGVAPPERVLGGPVVVTLTALKLRNRTQVDLSLKTGAKGSAGTVRVRAKNAFSVKGRKAKKHVIFKSDAYLVEPVTTTRVRLRLTAEGKALFRTKKTVKAIVEVDDAGGELRTRQPVSIKR